MKHYDFKKDKEKILSFREDFFTWLEEDFDRHSAPHIGVWEQFLISRGAMKKEGKYAIIKDRSKYEDLAALYDALWEMNYRSPPTQ